jgi:hypothetical protein
VNQKLSSEDSKGRVSEVLSFKCGSLIRAGSKKLEKWKQDTCLRSKKYRKKVRDHNKMLADLAEALKVIKGPRDSKGVIRDLLGQMKASTAKIRRSFAFYPSMAPWIRRRRRRRRPRRKATAKK